MNKKQLSEFQQFITNNNNNPYKILKCTKQDSQDLILKNYKKLRLKIKENQSNLSAHELEEELKRLDYSYKLLSDERLKKIYDEKGELEEELKKKRDDLKFKTLDLGLALLGFACETALIRVQTLPSSSHVGILKDTGLVMEEIHKRSGGTGFYRGFGFQFIITTVETFRRFLVERIFLTINTDLFYQPIQLFSKVIVNYPLLLLNDVISLSPPELSSIEILKLYFKNSSRSTLFYGISYYYSINMVSQVIRVILKNIGIKINDLYENSKIKSIDGNGSSTLKYLDLIYNNRFSRSLLHVLVCAPLYCIRSYYPLQVALHSIINNTGSISSITPPISPISIFKIIYSTQGFSRLYNGSLLMFISRLSKVLLYDFSVSQKVHFFD